MQVGDICTPVDHDVRNNLIFEANAVSPAFWPGHMCTSILIRMHASPQSYKEIAVCIHICSLCCTQSVDMKLDHRDALFSPVLVKFCIIAALLQLGENCSTQAIGRILDSKRKTRTDVPHIINVLLAIQYYF